VHETVALRRRDGDPERLGGFMPGALLQVIKFDNIPSQRSGRSGGAYTFVKSQNSQDERAGNSKIIR
jgi:hypothetical protein